MNYALSLIGECGFLTLPVLLLWLRASRPNFFRWWIIIVIQAAVGWLLVNVLIHFDYAYLAELWKNAEGEVDADLSRQLRGNGFKMGIIFVMGWFEALVYFIPWLIFYGIIQAARRHFQAKLQPPAPAPHDRPARSDG